MVKTSKVITFVLTLVLFISIAVPVHADDGSTADWSNFFNDDGTMKSDVVDVGVVEVQVDVPTGFAGDTTPTTYTYHVYAAANGDTIAVPTYETLMNLATPGQGSDAVAAAANADGSYQIGVGTGLTAIQIYSLMSELAKASSMPTCENCENYVPNEDIDIDAVITLLLTNLQAANGGYYSEGSTGYSDEFLYMWNLLKFLLGTGIDDETFATTYLYYTAGNCANSPLGCETLCQIVPTAEGCTQAAAEELDVTASCPASTIKPGTPTVQISKTAPNSPLVVGQDPAKRGVDVTYSATIPPTVYTYYIAIPVYKTVSTCSTEGVASGSGNCSSKSDGVMDGNTVNVRKLDHVNCEKHVLVYEEPVSSASATAKLTAKSIDWINNGLSVYYYGAKAEVTSYNLVPGLAVANTYCDSNKTCYASGTVAKIQIQEPGTYTLTFTVTTSGTPVTTGRTFSASGTFVVSFIAVRLIENGSD